MARILGICNVHDTPSLGDLTKNRSVASTAFLGRYTFVDFVLSNFANSNIDRKAILMERHMRSLLKHIGSGKIYNSNTKTGFTSLMFNEKYANNKGYNTDINNLIENHWVLDQSNADYIVIAPAHFVYRFDFNEMLKYHIEKKSAITMLYYKANDAHELNIGRDQLKLDENGRVLDICKNKGMDKECNISLETYIINRKKLEEILKFAHETSLFFSLRDVLSYLVNQVYIYTYEFKGYVRCIDSLASYKNVSLELLNQDVLNQLFSSSWPIYTRTYDTPPAKYKDNAEVKNCFISNGAIIDGKVVNSIIGRGVIIEKGAVIEDSIISPGVVISEGTHIKDCVVDKSAHILYKKELIGQKDMPLLVEEGSKI